MTAFTVVFFRSGTGAEPVRAWLRELPAAARAAIGCDLRVLQERWPVGMPLVRKMEPDLWEQRSTIPAGIARLFFTIVGQQIVILHAFVKKSRSTPRNELDTARNRLRSFKESPS